MSRLGTYASLTLCLFIAIGEMEHGMHVWYERTFMVWIFRLIDALVLVLPIFYCFLCIAKLPTMQERFRI